MMATVEKTIISPAEASGVAQASFEDTNNLLPFHEAFPLQGNDCATVVSWSPVIPASKTDAMGFRAWDAEAGYGRSQTTTGEEHTGLIPLSKKMHITERELIDHVGDSAYLSDKAAAHIAQLGMEAAVTAELARIDILVNAKYKIDALNSTYSFNRPAVLGNLAPTKQWADPVADIEAWVKTIRKQNGRTPAAAFTTSNVIDALRTNEVFRTAASGSSLANSKTRLNRAEVLDVLASECYLTDVRMVDVMYTQLEQENGLLLPVDVNTLIPDGAFIMMPSFNDPTLGFTAMGPTVEANDPEYGINRTPNEGLIAALLSDNAPVSYDVYVNGSLMPILAQSVSTGKATVL